MRSPAGERDHGAFPACSKGDPPGNMREGHVRAIEPERRAVSAGSIPSFPGLPELWSETLGDPRVVVAVLDGPVDRGHPSLAGARLDVIESTTPAAPDRRRRRDAARHGGGEPDLRPARAG